DDLLRDLLRRVSRSFYLRLVIQPRPIREPIGLAYLLARAADTVADTRLIAREERVRHVETLRRACAGQASDVAAVARACAPHQAHAAERRLLERLGEALARLEALPAEDRVEVRAVLATLTTGMPFDLARFPGEDAASLAALDTLGALAHYDVAWRYTLAIPRLEWRMRLACAWPLLIGGATLAALAAHPDPLAVTAPIKIPRGTVRALLARSALAVWSDTTLAAEAARVRRRIAL